ncbi:MAG: sigma-70 family RNA polymerase sigma factor, partial [Bacteroidia bacterium]|nr:sigma-70 family RNA polymerase sigma factor [Bacteroidia bacterium]
MVAEQFAREFESYRSQLKSYVLRMTANAEDAEDIVQDTYLKAHANLSNVRGDSSLKTWVFSIASNLTKDKMRAQKRWPENVTDICKEAALSNQDFFQEAMNIRHTSPHGNFEIKEHIAFCFL